MSTQVVSRGRKQGLDLQNEGKIEMRMIKEKKENQH